MILALLAVLDGGNVVPETRAELPIPDGCNADVTIVARIRDGRVALAVLGVLTDTWPTVPA